MHIISRIQQDSLQPRSDSFQIQRFKFFLKSLSLRKYDLARGVDKPQRLTVVIEPILDKHLTCCESESQKLTEMQLCINSIGEKLSVQ